MNPIKLSGKMREIDTREVVAPSCFEPRPEIVRASALALDEGERLRLACALLASVERRKGQSLDADICVTPDNADAVRAVGVEITDYAPHRRRLHLYGAMVIDARYLDAEGVRLRVSAFRLPTPEEANIIARRELVEGDEVRP